MRTLVAVAGTQEVDPTGLIVVGAICCLVAAYLGAAAFSARLGPFVRWGADGRGPRMSAAGAGAFAACALFFAVLLFAQALAWSAVSRFVFWLLFASIFIAVVVALRDYSRDRERI